MKNSLDRDEFEKTCLYLLHIGLVEIRRIAISQKEKQLEDIADILEVIPTYIMRKDRESMEITMKELKKYQNKYNEKCTEYLTRLSHSFPPPFT